jgi:hypothetical protein
LLVFVFIDFVPENDCILFCADFILLVDLLNDGFLVVYLDFYFLCDGKQKLMFFEFGLIDVFLVEFITEL